MYMTGDQYSWAMMKHGHKMLIIWAVECISLSVCLCVCARARDPMLCCLVFDASVDSLSLFAGSKQIDSDLSFFLSFVDCSISSYAQSQSFSLCITHISLIALNNFRWTIEFQSVIFLLRFVLFLFSQLLGYVRKRSSDRLFFLHFIFIYRKSN